jgi:predicted RNA-binding protein with PUA-like domain
MRTDWKLKNVGTNQWNRFLWSQQKNTNKKFQFGDYVLWFHKGENTHLGKFMKILFA